MFWKESRAKKDAEFQTYRETKRQEIIHRLEKDCGISKEVVDDLWGEYDISSLAWTDLPFIIVALSEIARNNALVAQR